VRSKQVLIRRGKKEDIGIGKYKCQSEEKGTMKSYALPLKGRKDLS